MNLLCRNRVTDFAQWRRVFDSHDAAHRTSGLVREWIRRTIEDPNEVFYSFRVTDLQKAKAFLSAPAVPEAQRESGFIEGQFWFVDDA